MIQEQRIYVVVAGTIQVPVTPNSHKPPLRTVVQPIGRQIAQACHAVSYLRHTEERKSLQSVTFNPVTTIILQARDSSELGHVFSLLVRKRLQPILFSDDNPEYGPGNWPTALAVYGTPKQIKGALDYLPLWGSK